ncbi:CDP-glycerol glycerophosphotransferase family protein [Dasania sp. GY-MA-18]|uniref:CDP-glycerol glycerophosphotransferase family protein n=1 Tax=Dasania phycosphaerae TaxID=2950436 RepID=A0A9J6RK24_9GAMM|nr:MULTISPECIES: CDP-glycerol glycerophosphotransferase family protein [Dasania]MCR8922115.1 CDP-glycerol glycerophosphotransferase family protein [Dasania sp. GY-MA-18]MCZ0864543.1 CDP-glycerol glycerophosphotransferase family protein [Dasania phycosphaerae]MCZ0868271.1 CDP-glycerol glycerophosphotransferase family protein [Dasania phycosphaerae]
MYSKRTQKRIQQITSLLSPLAKLLSLTVIKTNSKQQIWGFLLSEHQGLDGNVRAMLDYAYQQANVTPYIINARDDEIAKYQQLYPGITVVFPHSWRQGHFRLRCNTHAYFVTHGTQELRGLYGMLKPKVINLWHGIPLKGMCNLDYKFKRSSLAKLFKRGLGIDAFCVSSMTERALIAGCFLMDAQRIKVTGIPRNDWLTSPAEQLPQDLAADQSKLKALLNGKKLILYAPTFRDYDRKACGFTTETITQLKAILAQHNAVLGIRAHPRDQGLFSPFIDNTNVLDLDYRHYPELNTVMRNTDILITDYSSLWVDFLLLDKPIVGYAFDMEQYQGARGLLYDYENQFPGPLTQTWPQLASTLEALLAQSSLNVSEKQQWLKRFFHQPLEGSRCQAIEQLVAELS